MVQGKIVVLYGGPSTESAVSKMSADAVFEAIQSFHANVEKLEYSKNWVANLQKINPAFVFNAMHGCPGEDGRVQATLDELGFPYQGSGFTASVKAMDKNLSKKEFASVGLDVPKAVLFSAVELPASLPFYPVFIKPNHGGSSVNTFKVENEAQWPEVKSKLQHANDGMPADDVLVEEFVQGREFTVAVMGGRTLGVMEMRPNEGRQFFDYAAKYTKGMTEYIYPAPIATEVYNKAESEALKAHKALGCTGVSRVDFLYDEVKNRLVILEVNTLPGMTSTSLVPKMAKAHHMSYEEVLVWMIEDGLNTHKNNR